MDRVGGILQKGKSYEISGVSNPEKLEQDFQNTTSIQERVKWPEKELETIEDKINNENKGVKNI